MNLYRIWQDANPGYDTHDSAIVRAESEELARHTKPDSYEWGSRYSSWCESPDDVGVELIGIAVGETEPGIVLASFNAG